MVANNTIPTDEEQRQLLMDLREGGGYGILAVLLSDVTFAASPVPRLVGYEIVCATRNRLYDIWKDGKPHKMDLTRKQVREWIRQRTPKWLYDEKIKPTKKQEKQLKKWMVAFHERYPALARMSVVYDGR